MDTPAVWSRTLLSATIVPMYWLLLVSLVWAASFGLIKTHLTSLDPDAVNAARLLLALVVFVPWLRRPRGGIGLAIELAAVGAVQFGAMYALYTRSYQVLAAHQVALATIMTPLYVALMDDLLERRVRPAFLGCAALAVIGTAISVGASVAEANGLRRATTSGLLLVQAANLCFAAGQVWYRRVMARAPGLTNARAFAWCILGGAVVAMVFGGRALASVSQAPPTAVQVLVLAYLGLVASGGGFFLWNVGARQVNAGVLAVMNDLKIPLGMLVALLVFGERAAWGRLLVGGTVVGLAWYLATLVGRAPSRPTSRSERVRASRQPPPSAGR